MSDDSQVSLQAAILPAMRGGLSADERSALDGHLASLSERQLRFLAIRLHVETDEEAGEQCEVSTATLSRWRTGPHLSPALSLLRRASVWESLSLVREQMLALAPKAVEAIARALSSGIPWLEFNAGIALLDRLGVQKLSELESQPAEVSALAAWLAAARTALPVTVSGDEKE